MSPQGNEQLMFLKTGEKKYMTLYHLIKFSFISQDVSLCVCDLSLLGSRLTKNLQYRRPGLIPEFQIPGEESWLQQYSC